MEHITGAGVGALFQVSLPNRSESGKNEIIHVEGSGIGAIYKKIVKNEEDFECDRLDSFRIDSLGKLESYADLVDAFLQRKDRDNGKGRFEKEIIKKKNLLSEVESKKREAARFFNDCVRDDLNDWVDDPMAILNARKTLNSYKAATNFLEEQLVSDLELLEKTSRPYLLSQNTLLRPQHRKVLEEFDRLKGVDRSLHSEKYFRKLEKIENALFDFFLSLMKLGATRCENYRRGKEYLENVVNQTLEVEVLAKGLERTEDQKMTLAALSEVFRDIVRDTPQKYK